MPSWARRVATISLLAACGGKSQPPPAPIGVTSTQSAPPRFEFDSLDERPVSSDAMRGKPVVMAFVGLGNIGSQMQVNYLIAMNKNDGDRVAYALVFMVPRNQRELVEIYRRSLGVDFPVALPDEATLNGTGPLGEMPLVPTVVVLDRMGRITQRIAGRVATSDELRGHLKGL
jgi:hypothetical protein